MPRKPSEQILFECIYCRSQFAIDYVPPEKWTVFRHVGKDHFKYICTDCGAFIYPVSLVAPGDYPDADIFFMFAGCINAWECYLWDQYDPQCESLTLRPKCLRALHLEIDALAVHLETIEKHVCPQPSGQQSKKGGKKPGKELS